VRSTAVVVVALAISLGGCIARSDGGGHSFSALNDTDNVVVVEVRTTALRTIAIPPHTYVGLAGGWSNVDPSWAVTVWNADCRLILTEPIKVGDGVLYIGADSRVEWHPDTSSASPYTSQDSPAPTMCPSL
jgi:hypothetical protein